MNMERKDTAIKRHKPQVFLNSISFNDGTKISLKPNSIVVFTGANNCGKSQVLKDIELWLNGENQSPTVVIKDLDVDFIGSIDEETFLHEHFFLNSQGNICNRNKLARNASLYCYVNVKMCLSQCLQAPNF